MTTIRPGFSYQDAATITRACLFQLSRSGVSAAGASMVFAYLRDIISMLGLGLDVLQYVHQVYRP